MQNNKVTLLLILIFLTACGAQIKDNTQVDQAHPTSITPVNSIESMSIAIKEAGFTLNTFDSNSQKIQKKSSNNIRILFNATQELSISTHTLYSVTNENNQSIIATIDNTLLNNIEENPSFVIYHQLPLLPYGFTNLNTTLTDVNATITTILKKIEKAFTQKTLNNPSIQQVTYTTVDDVNVSYQTALKNQDETFECNGESKIIDATKGYTTLNNLPIGIVLCTFGINKIPMLDFNVTQEDTTPPIITLNGKSRLTLKIGEDYIELGAIATDNIDGNLSIQISGSVNTTKAGRYLLTYSAEDKAGNSTQKSREVKVNSSIPFTEELDIEEKEIEIEEQE